MSSISLSNSSDFFANTHQVMATNVKNIEDARVIGLGENHLKNHHRIKNSWVLDKLYRPGDVVLIEGLGRGQKIEDFQGLTEELDQYIINSKNYVLKPKNGD